LGPDQYLKLGHHCWNKRTLYLLACMSSSA
jgi:hypothetical protein